MASVKDNEHAMGRPDAVQNGENRNRQIVRAGIIGIVTNILLAGFKALIGLASNSIAIILDAVNNLSDAGSSLITIIGAKLAEKEPDRKHPYGYGRVEYLSASIIAVIVLYAGVTSLVESIKKIIHPETASYSGVTLLIIAVAVVVKIVLGTYVKSTGKKVNSDALVASGTDALMDSIISASTLVAAVIYMITGVSLEAWLGAIIALLIIKAGCEMLQGTISQLLGERVDNSLAAGIKATVNAFPEVSGVYDLVLNDYGPDKYTGSLHIEIPADYTASQIDVLTRRISTAVYLEHNVILLAVSVYPLNPENSREREIENHIREIVQAHEHALQMHGFSLDEENKILRFDTVISFNAPDRRALLNTISEEVQAEYPGYHVYTVMDTDYSES